MVSIPKILTFLPESPYTSVDCKLVTKDSQYDVVCRTSCALAQFSELRTSNIIASEILHC